jgi:FkbM family methyltransferase
MATMINKETLKELLRNVETIANYSKINRFLNNPHKYITAMFHRHLLYRFTRKEKIVMSKLFFNSNFKLALPSSTDIYLTGGKSHHSEIKLAHFLIDNLKTEDSFLDIGAHIGYFTLLASTLVGQKGTVVSAEPTINSFKLLQFNTSTQTNITCLQKAISSIEEEIIFYEFPNLYSEYNSSNMTQFENENWYKKTPPKKVIVEATTIDAITLQNNFNPTIIKIDVEGAEHNVLLGGMGFIKKYLPIIVMEYLEPNRSNSNHLKALNLLINAGYASYVITKDGKLEEVNDVDQYFTINKIESDNIVFKKVITA